MTAILGRGYRIGKDGKLKKTGPTGYSALKARGKSKRGHKRVVSSARARLLAGLK